MGSGHSSQTNPNNQKIIQDGWNGEMTFKLQNKKRKRVGYNGQAPCTTEKVSALRRSMWTVLYLYLMKQAITNNKIKL